MIVKSAQKALKDKSVAVIGIGSTGCAVVEKLSTVGLKRIVLIDRDIVEPSNLRRQKLYTIKDINKPKVIAAKERIQGFCAVQAVFDDLNERTINLKGVDVVIDCTDNMETRFILNDYCAKNKIPWIYVGAIGPIGSIYFNSPGRPCFACFNEGKHGETCSSAGILSSTITLLSSLVASMALAYLTQGIIEHDLIRINMKSKRVMNIKIKKNKKCSACKGIYRYLSGKDTKKVMKLCGNDQYAIIFNKKIDLKEIANRLRLTYIKGQQVLVSSNMIVFSYGKILVKAQTEAQAKKIYDKMVGI